MALAVGDKLGPYEITAPIGSGGMGEVWRARDPRLNREVAIKVSAERFGERFAREARAIAALDHPNVCQVYDVGPNYLVMELVAGETLASRIKKGPLGMEQTLRYGAQIADALAAAHSKGIVHRDLKPANIMINKAGAKVLDFGLAKSQQDETVTVTNAVMGTPAYMAPEQRAGRESDARTDIYALGLVLTEMTTGNRQNTAHLQGHFAHIVERCLAANPEDRWQAASDVKAELHYAAKTADAGDHRCCLPRFGRRRMVASLSLGRAAAAPPALLLYHRRATRRWRSGALSRWRLPGCQSAGFVGTPSALDPLSRRSGRPLDSGDRGCRRALLVWRRSMDRLLCLGANQESQSRRRQSEKRC